MIDELLHFTDYENTGLLSDQEFAYTSDVQRMQPDLSAE